MLAVAAACVVAVVVPCSCVAWVECALQLLRVLAAAAPAVVVTEKLKGQKN